MKQSKFAVVCKILLPLIIIALCWGYCGKLFGSSEFILNRYNIMSLEEKKESVLSLTAGAAGISSAITVLPGDVCTPIAEELSDLVGYFLVITSAILFEKYLVTITGVIGFYVIIPLGCVLYLLHVIRNNRSLKRAGLRIALFGLAIYLVIPASGAVTKLIEKTYETSIQTALQNTQAAVDEINGAAQEKEAEAEEKGWLKAAADSVKSTVQSITVSTEEMVEKAKNALNSYIEATAIMVITCCVIPIAVIFVFAWMIKIIFGIRAVPDAAEIAAHLSGKMPETETKILPGTTENRKN